MAIFLTWVTGFFSTRQWKTLSYLFARANKLFFVMPLRPYHSATERSRRFAPCTLLNPSILEMRQELSAANNLWCATTAPVRVTPAIQRRLSGRIPSVLKI